jgi:hypothetical protein
MIRPGPLRRAARALAFGRHIPVRRLARRVELDLRRRLRDGLNVGIPSALPLLERARAPLRSLLPAPGRHIEIDDRTVRFTFLGRSETMPRSRIDWQAPGAGPVHQLWRMNLHYMEYLKDVPDAAWSDLVADWIDANPPCRNGAWKDSWNSYALSLRAVAWMQELACRGHRLPAGLVARVERSLAQQLVFLEQNLETDLGGNHLVKNIKALLWASAFFAGPRPARWRAVAIGLLRQELHRQVLADGMHAERSPSYHCQVFADLLACRQALSEDALGGALDDALHRMAQAAADLVHPDGGVALFNDAGLAMSHAPADCLDACERLLGRRAAPRKVFALEQAGYYGLRAGGNFIVVDCGPIAPDDLPAHGHGDVLSFEWSVGGQRIVVDQGVFEYVAGARRQRSRSAASHNTLCFEGSDQADFFGAFRCGRRPDARVLTWAPRLDGFTLEGTHDGFRHLAGAPRHVRRFEASAGALVIHDRIEGRADRPAFIGVLLHPEVQVEVSGSAALLRRGCSRIGISSTRPIQVEGAVWWPDMGCEQQTRRLRVGLSPDIRHVTTTFRVI